MKELKDMELDMVIGGNKNSFAKGTTCIKCKMPKPESDLKNGICSECRDPENRTQEILASRNLGGTEKRGLA